MCSWKGLWKVMGIVVLLVFIFAAYKLLAWAFYVRVNIPLKIGSAKALTI